MSNITVRNSDLVGPKPKDSRVHDENSGLGEGIGEPVNGRVEETSPDRREGKERGEGREERREGEGGRGNAVQLHRWL